jgi:DNA-3-methyladenine glycosylase
VSSHLPRRFFARDPLDVAPDLLGKVLVAGSRSGRIVEVEAYRGRDDPASHGYRGVTPRTEVMYGPPGHLYVYFSYGMHWCANVVCGPIGTCGAVLIRALEPLTGLEAMWTRRPKAHRERDLCSGPAKLCQALSIDGEANGVDLIGARQETQVQDDGWHDDGTVGESERIGLGDGKGQDLRWRFYVEGNPNVSVSPR